MNERIKEVRKALGLSQEEFGRRLGVTRGAVTNIELNKVEPKQLFVELLCREFNVSYEWLSTGRGDMFEDLPETLLSEVAQQYHLNPQDIQIIKAYLELTEQERTVVQKYLRAALGQQ